ncbi:unnamed protein product [Ilex paraguariensis]|uniref:Uncharacterized protein n=1 Tax=Ilex paraguariensis TaxID=185542 RepID=A0ABC8SEP2_9AQUA
MELFDEKMKKSAIGMVFRVNTEAILDVESYNNTNSIVQLEDPLSLPFLSGKSLIRSWDLVKVGFSGKVVQSDL